MLNPLIQALKGNSSFNTFLLVGGAHLSASCGTTINEIEKDGLKADATFPFLEKADDTASIVTSLGTFSHQLAIFLSENAIDLLIVLGDRYEILPVVTAAALFSIPVAHISGGDITTGVIDDQIRHAVTKMSHLHFPGTQKSAETIKQLGEDPTRVHPVGELSLDRIRTLETIEWKKLESNLDLSSSDIVICTFHPETIDKGVGSHFVRKLLEALASKGSYEIMVTGANSDPGGHEINQACKELAQKVKNIHFEMSLGQIRYFSLLKYAKLMIGNSSSGIVEAKLFDLPVINIGSRQNGRDTNSNVFNCSVDVEETIKLADLILSKSIQTDFPEEKSIYGDGHTAQRIVSILEKTNLKSLYRKKFHRISPHS